MSLHDEYGGRDACKRLAVAFYSRVAQDPILRHFYPGKTFTGAIEEFAAYLAQFLDGPPEDAKRRWWLSPIFRTAPASSFERSSMRPQLTWSTLAESRNPLSFPKSLGLVGGASNCLTMPSKRFEMAA